MTLGPKVICSIKGIHWAFDISIGMPGINAFKMYRGGQIFSIFGLLKGKIKVPISFKLNDLGTKGHMCY